VRLTATGAGSLTTTTDVVSWNDGLVTADITSADPGTQTITATVQDPDNLTQVASGVSTVNQSVVWGAQAVTVVPESKKITFNFYNLVGQKATITEGKSKTTVNVTLANQPLVKKYAKGKHVLKIVAGTVTKTVTVVVP
jgi:hypothetical protein